MSDQFGASRETWLYWDLILGLGADLLPVVCEPNLPISPTSALTSYGKVPSRFDSKGCVVGFPKWTQHQASDADLEKWSADSRLGICLQTRRVRAIDVDVDSDLSDLIFAAIDQLHFLPRRYRKNSKKFLLLFEMEGDYSKQVLQTAGGAIEFLATGQQCVVAGHHPSGVPYEWEGGLDRVMIPALDELDFDHLMGMLEKTFGNGNRWSAGRSAKSRVGERVSGLVEGDDVCRYLREKGLVIGDHSDRLDVACPWVAEHTTGGDQSASSYFPAGTGGFATGAYKCLHAHCMGRDVEDFLDAIGWTLDGFSDISTGVDGATVEDFVGSPGASEGGAKTSPLSEPRFLRNPSTNAIKVLVKNVVEALRHPEWCKLMVRYDTFRSVVMIGPPESCRPIRDRDSTGLNILLAERGFGPGAVSNDMIERAIDFVAHEREFDAAIEWLRSLTWDGVPRVESFCHHYLMAEDTPYHRAVSRYWWTSHAGRVLVPAGVQADASIILVSQQGTGKTQLIKAISPKPEYQGTINLSGDHYNRIREMRGRVVIELAELQGLKSRDAESIKAIISAMGDTFVDKWEKHAQDVVRRCVFIGSSNNDDFLSDPTGNRRFLPVYVGNPQDVEGLTRDRDQLWAEGAVRFDALGGVDWREAQALVLAEHCKFEEIDAWEERVFEWLDQPGNWIVRASATPFVTAHHVLREAIHMDTQRQGMRDMHRIGRILVRYGLVKVNNKVEGHQTKIWVRKETKDLA